MGVSVSGWKLARAVSRAGQLGVVSGTALAVPFANRLQQGDPGGHLRRAAKHFPYPGVAERILERYYIHDGKRPEASYRPCPIPVLAPSAPYLDLTVLATFAEIYLAKEGHDGIVGINLLEKIQLPTLPTLFGAMLAGVDYVLMGAGIPRSIPGVLDRLARGESVSMRVDVEGAGRDEQFFSEFSPKSLSGYRPTDLKRPVFLAIVSNATLALTLAKKSNGRVDGFVVEGETAGGHNAPPRGPLQINSGGEPVYGVRDVPDMDKIKALGLPFWLAGSYGRVDMLAAALALGAQGIQVGTAFAFCEESGLLPEYKRRAIALNKQGQLKVFTDPVASPTSFPFKIVQMPGTLSEKEVYERRPRICDLGYLRHLYRLEDGSIGYRCPAEPEDDYVRKGGTREDACGRKCICNGLAAAVGIGQVRAETGLEPALVTAGSTVSDTTRFLSPGSDSYSAADVLARLLA